MRKATSSVHFFLLVLFVFLLIFSVMSEAAWENHAKKHKHKKPKNHRGKAVPRPLASYSPSPSPSPSLSPFPSPSPSPSPSLTTSNIFNLLSFGAKGDGSSDDSMALVAAWEGACRVPGATIEVPSEFKFLIKPITLQGPCAPGLIFQIDGMILAPADVWSGPKFIMFQWMNFKWLHNFTIQGTGTVDGRGAPWWTTKSSSKFHAMKKKTSKFKSRFKPTALRFYASYNVTVRDIKITNSANCHLKFDNSVGVKVHNLTISSPETSSNTDGIHLQNSQDVEIHHSNIGCGDDCVSIQTGCSNVHVHHINCGPGHGISIGGLGKGGSVACVSNIVVQNSSMNSTMYGARIKTWQGGLGAVKNVSFSNIQMDNVKVPVMIDQYYCDKHACKNQTGAVAISGVEFDQITGTYTAQPLHLACSNSVPCTDVKLSAIHLQPSPGFRGSREALCWNSFGRSEAPLVPSSIDYCVRKQSNFLQKIARSHEKHC